MAHMPRDYDPAEVCLDHVKGEPRGLWNAYVQFHTAAGRVVDDPSLLIELLRSDAPMCRDARDVVAQIFEMYRVRRKPGPKVTPGLITVTEGELNVQASHYRHYRQKGLDHADALIAALVDHRRFQIYLASEPDDTPDDGEAVDEPTDEDLAALMTDEEIDRLENRVLGKRGSAR
jgi:hypothetical protein